MREEGRHVAVSLSVHTKHSQKAGPFSVARLKMDLPFHNRLAYNRVPRRSASPLVALATCRVIASTYALVQWGWPSPGSSSRYRCH